MMVLPSRMYGLYSGMKSAPEFSKPSSVNGPLRSNMQMLCMTFSSGPPKCHSWSHG
ncbi:hypothetical protein D3C84_1312050 [compost metagenome]